MPGTKGETEKDAICGKCRNTVQEHDLGIGCEGPCQEWYHKECTEISSGEYDILKRKKCNLTWICSNCKPEITHGYVAKELAALKNELMEQLKHLRDENINLTAELKEMKTMISKLKQNNPELTERNSNTQLSGIQNAIQNKATPIETTQENPETEEPVNVETSAQLPETLPGENGINRNGTATLNSSPRQVTGTKKPLMAAVVRGSAPQNEFAIRAAPRREWLFIGNLDPDTSEESIIDHCKGLGVTHITCETLSTYITKSFKIGILSEEQSILKSPEAWPADIKIQPFRPRKPNRRRPHTRTRGNHHMEYRRD